MRISCRRERGVTVVELLIILAIVGTVATIVVPAFLQTLANIKVKAAIADIVTISFNVNQYLTENDELPDDLDDLGPIPTPRVDPWGYEYVYRPSTAADWNGTRRRDRWLNPLNSDFDVYSVGRDGLSKAPLAPPQSHDDVIRANDGGYVGLAWKF